MKEYLQCLDFFLDHGKCGSLISLNEDEIKVFEGDNSSRSFVLGLGTIVACGQSRHKSSSPDKVSFRNFSKGQQYWISKYLGEGGQQYYVQRSIVFSHYGYV